MITLIGLLLSTTFATPTLDCDTYVSRGRHISTSGDSDDSYSVMTYTRVDNGHCESAAIVGKLTYTPDEDDVISIPFGGSATFRERTGSADRALNLTRGADGNVVRSYQLNGRSAEYDADARRWFAEFLPRVLAYTGVNAGPRVARWRAQGGVDNVLRHIEDIGASGSMRAHYDALLDEGNLSEDDLDRVIRSASDHLRGSSGDIRHVLSRLAPANKISKRNISALEDAMSAIPSSGDKAAVLTLFGESTNRDVRAAVARSARTIASSGDKTRVLRAIVEQTVGDAELRPLWFTAAATVPSSGDLRSTLQSAMSLAANNADVANDIIAASRLIASSGDRSSVLIALVRSGALRDKTTRQAFETAAMQIPSDGDKARVLRALFNEQQ